MARTSCRRLLLVGLLAALPASALLGQPPAQPPPDRPLPNGVYLVLRRAAKEKDVLPAKAGEAVVPHRHRYLKKGGDQPTEYLALHRTPDVPLKLAAKPEGVKDDAGNLRIELQLARNGAEKLERLTRDNLGKEVAILVGGEVVTTHKVRSAITGGKAQITCCGDDGACAYLLKQLEKCYLSRERE
jgi:hypothetical protein